MTITKQNSGELKTRVYNCLNRLSDRDTLSIATNELESIAKNLQNDSFAPFLNCLSNTDTSDKSPVRRQCVRLIGILSAAHGDALSPHLSRMISAVLRRLRDPDSAVRSACVDSISSISAHVNKAPFCAILRPLIDALFREQDLNAQIGAAMCLSAAIEAAREVDAIELRKVLPRVLKLVRSEGFKAKSAVLVFICSVVSAGCVKSRSLLSGVVLAAVEFLSSGDWAVRKAAADVLEKVAVVERVLVVELKVNCVAALESKRFDRVKVVRETMNRALEAWRDVPLLSEELLSSPEDCSSNGNSSALFSSSASDSGYETPQPRKMTPSMSPVSSTSSSTSSSRKGIAKTEDSKTSTPAKTEDSKTRTPAKTEDSKTSTPAKTEDSKTRTPAKIEDSKTCTPSTSKLNLRNNYRSRVVPFNSMDELNMADEDAVKDGSVDEKEFEDLSLIRNQLLQIEDQQSNLLHLLQRFIGNSQKGMSYLEKRVDGLEKVLDEMSQDLAISTQRRIHGTESGENTCCMLPGAEFLSPKFWRKAEGGQNVGSKFNSSFRSRSSHGVARKTNTMVAAEMSKLDSPRN